MQSGYLDAVDTERKIELLQQQIDEAAGGDPEDFTLWRERTGVVLRNVVGDANALYKSFEEVRYSLSAWSTSTPQSRFDAARRAGVRHAISILEAAKIDVELSGGAPQPAPGTRAIGASVFVVHGRDEARKHEMARFLAKVTGREPVILHEQSNHGQTLIEKFVQHASDAAYAVVIATGDDRGRAKGDTQDQARARQNVVFELGFFFGALGRERVALLYEEDIERPSDLDGLVRIPLDPAGGWKLLLARQLAAAGVGIQWDALA